MAIVDGEKILGEYTFNSPARSPSCQLHGRRWSGAGRYERLSKILVPAIDELLSKTGLKSKELDGIAVAKGPGLFTGGRIGISVAKGLSMGLNIPVVGISTLEGLALNLPYASLPATNKNGQAGYPICPMIPSRGQDVFVGIYKFSSRSVKPVRNKPRQRRGGFPNGLRKIEGESVFNLDEWLNRINEPTIFIGEGAIKYKDIIKKKLGKSALFVPLSLNYLRGSDIAHQALGRITKATKLSSLNLKAEYLRPAVDPVRSPHQRCGSRPWRLTSNGVEGKKRKK